MQKKELAATEQKMRSIVEENPYMRYLGIELVEIKRGYALGRMKYSNTLTNPYGMFHGGSLYSLADIIAGSAACMEGHFVTTVSGTMNFLLPAVSTEYVYCEATALREGKHLAVYSVKIRDDHEAILDSGEFTFFVTDHETA